MEQWPSTGSLSVKQKAGTPEQEEVVDLAAGAMFKKAEGIRKNGDLSGAAVAFKDINKEFPSSKVADRGWFEAGVCYETLKNYDAAAETFRKPDLDLPQINAQGKSVPARGR
jgi:TolA-binding protein